MNMQELLLHTFDIYELPGQSLWRALELLKIIELREQIGFDEPVLEIGCGDGIFSSSVFERIDDAIDVNLNAINRARKLNGFYGRLSQMDARNMVFGDLIYNSVFANCVLEHIPDVLSVIKSSHRVLKKGGKFVTTVPLLEMNNHLLLKSSRYAKLRKYQLSHINLLSGELWTQMFFDAGFSHVEIFPYLGGDQCHLWDSLDFPISIGFRRFTFGNAIRLLTKILPKPFIRKIRLSISKAINTKLQNLDYENPCAIVIIAYK